MIRSQARNNNEWNNCTCVENGGEREHKLDVQQTTRNESQMQNDDDLEN